MPRARRQEAPTLDHLGDIFQTALNNAVARPTLANYKPHPKQVLFHQSDRFTRLLIGGNRSGKTVGGITEDVMYMTGRHKFRDTPRPPLRGRICTVSFNEGIQQIIIPELAKWLAPSDLIGGSWEESYRPSKRLLTLENGSTAQLMSYDQDLQKFMGNSLHWVHMDEEPPKNIFNENKLRVLDTQGKLWLTLTPVDGMTWVYDEIYLPGLENSTGNILIVEVAADENPYLTDEQIQIVFEGMDADEIEIRRKGKFVQIGGRVFKGFTPDIILPEPIVPRRTFTHYASMDHGFNAPTAWLFHAVLPNGAIITYDEIYDREKVVPYYAAAFKERCSQPGRRWPDFIVGDPAIKQRQGVTGDSIQTAYAQHGVYIAPGNNEVQLSVEKINRYINAGMWVVTPNCSNFIREMMRVRWKTYETAKKRDENPPREELHRQFSHSPDAARYFIGMMPDLYISKRDKAIDRQKALEATLSAMLGARSTYRRFAGGRDLGVFDPSFEPQGVQTEWSPTDEHLGGIY